MNSARRFALSALTGLALVALPLAAFASDWDVDPAHSRVGFSVRHMMVSNVHGTFDKFTGTVALDEKDPAKSMVNVDIEAASIDTGNAKRDEHLRSAEFFDTAKFPKITFRSTRVEKTGGGLAVTGDLTIKGVTKPTVLNVAPISPEAKGMDGNMHRGTSATAKINRKDFNLVWNKTLETGGVAVGDEITLEIDVEMAKKK